VTEGFLRRLLCLMLALFWSVSASAANDRIDITAFSLEASSDGDGAVANADFFLNLGSTLEEVVNRGVPLYFKMEIEVTRPRWYWRDVRVLEVERTYRLSYNALTRRYRLVFGSYSQNFPSLTEALLSMVRVRGWKIAERDVLKRGDSYEAQMRFRLDLTQMPKPFQINAITNRDWVLSTEWKSVQYSP
jgi:Domain of unknown function (DUF4390)